MIMKKIVLLFAAVAILIVSGCVKEQIQATEDQISAGEVSGVTVLTAGISTKTVLVNDETVLWTDGDQIAVNGETSLALELEEPVSAASFTIDAVLEHPYKAIFPASAYKDNNIVTLPEYQQYKAGSFKENASPMAAYTEEGNALKFHHLCAVLKLIINKPAESNHAEVVYVDFYGKNNEQVAGDFAVDYENATLTGVAADGVGRKLRYKVNKTLGNDAFEMYIVVPALRYENGYTVKIVDAQGHFMEQSKKSAQDLVAGHVYEMNEFSFVPTGTELGVEIASAEDLINFANNYNAGVYAKEDLLVATLTQDIVFDAETSAAFAATGGIGLKYSEEETNYFNGVFNGNGMTIKGCVSNVPMFAYIGGAGKISKVHFDSTCQLTVNVGAADTYHALLAGRNKGVIADCTSAASVVINNLADVSTATQYYGGLVGRNYGGEVKNSVVTGDITCAQTGVTISKNTVSIGGVVGGQADKGSISGCTFKGNITVSDGTEFGGISAAKIYFYVGGVVGHVENGVVADCAAGVEGISTKIELRGTLVPAIGGVISWVVNSKSTEISGCTNYMSMSFASNGARADTTPCRLGGIASHSAAPIANCNNYGPMSSLGNSTSVYMGGISGDGVGASYCTNHSTGKITRTSQLTNAQGNRYIYLGGIMGGITAAGDFENCTNNAAVLNGNTGTSTNTTVDLGGIVGAAYDGGNAHQLDFKDCVNTGTITAQATQTSAVVLARTTVGGIIGYGAAASTTVKDCNNSGYIYCQYNTTKSNGRAAYSGGIAGLLGNNAAGAGGLEINGCDNTGIVYNRNFNNTLTLAGGTFGGGIVGAINGTADSKAKLQNCTSTVGNMNCYRGINGGIAGYAGNATLSNNTASQAINPNANVEGNGGVVGWLVGSDMSGCTFSGSSFDPTANTLAKNFGGLVYLMDGTSSITDCKVDGATIKKGSVSTAVLVNNAAAGATISNCGVKGTLDGAAITLASTMVATDGGATVTGTYLLD